jgi:hypothetical protein
VSGYFRGAATTVAGAAPALGSRGGARLSARLCGGRLHYSLGVDVGICWRFGLTFYPLLIVNLGVGLIGKYPLLSRIYSPVEALRRNCWNDQGYLCVRWRANAREILHLLISKPMLINRLECNSGVRLRNRLVEKLQVGRLQVGKVSVSSHVLSRVFQWREFGGLVENLLRHRLRCVLIKRHLLDLLHHLGRSGKGVQGNIAEIQLGEIQQIQRSFSGFGVLGRKLVGMPHVPLYRTNLNCFNPLRLKGHGNKSFVRISGDGRIQGAIIRVPGGPWRFSRCVRYQRDIPESGIRLIRHDLC